jgi:hypothetical protein
LEEEGALADARLAPEQGDRTGHQTAAENPVELTDACGMGLGELGVDLVDGNGERWRGRRGAGWTVGDIVDK